MLTQSLVLMLVMQFSGIDGQVRDARTHREIPAAKVDVSSSRIPVDRQYADGDGRFHFANVQPGSYVISVESPGYNPATVEIDVAHADAPRPVIVELNRTRTQPEQRADVVPVNGYRALKTAQKEFESGRKEAARQDCGRAVTHFEKGLRLYGQDASALNDLGICYRKLSQFDNAESAFKRAAALSDSVYISMNLAELYGSQRRFGDAEDIFRETIRRRPQEGDVFYGLAVLYFQQGLIDASETSALRATSLTHKIADVHLLLAKIYARKNDSGAVVSELKAYLKEDPKGQASARVKKALKDHERTYGPKK